MSRLRIVRRLSGSYRYPATLKFETVARAVVDSRLFDALNRYRWRLDDRGYPIARVDGKHVRLHQLVWLLSDGQLPEHPSTIDHKDRNKLNARRANLRSVAQSTQNANQRGRKDNRSGFRGVSWYKPTGKWRAEVKFNGSRNHLGYFGDPFQAARAVNRFYRENYPDVDLPNPAAEVPSICVANAT